MKSASDETVYKGQTYHRIGSKPHVRRDGSETRLDIWRSRCARCGEWFEFMRPADEKVFSPNRRCIKHKEPGRKVRVIA